MHLPNPGAARILPGPFAEQEEPQTPTPKEVVVRMAIRIKARSGESSEQMMRRFKKLCEKEGLTKEVKRRQFYEKPSERRRRDARRGVKRVPRT